MNTVFLLLGMVVGGLAVNTWRNRKEHFIPQYGGEEDALLIIKARLDGVMVNKVKRSDMTSDEERETWDEIWDSLETTSYRVDE